MKISNFAQALGPVIYRRGVDYWKQGRVKVEIAEDNYFRATVRGTKKYTTIVETDGDEITRTHCSCPYGLCCKHTAALLYEIRMRRKAASGQENVGGNTLSPNVKSNTDAAATMEQTSISFHGTEMSEKELFFLCYLTYAYKDIYYLQGKQSVPNRAWSFTQKEQKGFVRHLVETGWMVSSGHSWYTAYYSYIPETVSPNKVILVLCELVVNRPDWLLFLQKKWNKPSEVMVYLIQLVELLSGKRVMIDKPWKYRSSQNGDNQWLFEVFCPLVETESPATLNAIWTDAPFYNTLAKTLRNAYYEENVELLRKTGEVLAQRSPKAITQKQLHLLYLLYWFYATGELLPLKVDEDLSGAVAYANAVQLLYQGDYDKAILSYKKGLKQEQEIGVWKFIPRDPITFLTYVMALGLRRSEADVALLRRMLKKRTEILEQPIKPIFVLVDFFQSTDQKKDSSPLRTVLTNQNTPHLLKSISALILYFFEKQNELDGKVEPPRFALLQCEGAPFGWSEKGAWGYEPVLSRVQKHEAWELELEELIRSVKPENTAKNAEQAEQKEGRLYYLWDEYMDELDIYEQKRLKSGKWGKGKKVSFLHYNPQDLQMDEADTAIYNAWSRSSRARSADPSMPVFLVLPYLKGTDKLCLEGRKGLEPISIREEQPFLFTCREGDTIGFETNIPEDVETGKEMWVDRSLQKEWVYYPMDAKAQKIVERLLQLEKVPVAAEPMLQTLFEALKGQVEIHSDIVGAAAIEKVQGQTHLTLRIAPQGSMFRVGLGIYPLPNGKQIFFPAWGNECIYDAQEGRRMEVTRDMKGEKNALRKFNAYYISLLHSTPFAVSENEKEITAYEMLQLLETAPQYERLFSIEWQDGTKMSVRQADAAGWSVSAQPQGGWFELEGEISLTEDHVLTMAQLLAIFRESDGNYIRLSPTDYVKISEDLRRQLARIEAIAQTGTGKVKLPKLAYTILGGSLQGEMEIQEPDSLLQLRERIRQSDRQSFSVPDNLNATLRDYQVDGFGWMMRLNHWGAGACLADDMGLGKTVQTIAVLLAHAQEGAQLVVAPASVVGNWKQEILRFAPSLNPVVFYYELRAEERAACVAHLHANDVLILTYGMLVSESETITPKEWVTVCLDEAHTIKNRDTKSSAAAMQLKAANRIILTGTPIQNHLGELWNLMQFINPGLLGSYDYFTEHFINPVAAGNEDTKLQLKRLIAPFMLRRTKQEVAHELPDKVEIQVPVTMSEDEMAVYEVLRREAKAQLETSATVNVNTLAMITKLREAACDVSLVEKKWKGASSKLDALLDKLLPMVEQGNRVLVFSQFTSFLKMAKHAILDAGVKDMFYLDGSTPIKERQSMVEAFQSGKGQVFLISLKAGGLGLNLTGANYVIHLDPWWNPAIEQQATDRAYRIGQSQKVTVYHLIAEHTIEEKILRLHQTKQSLADSLLEGTNMSHKLTTQDLLELLA